MNISDANLNQIQWNQQGLVPAIAQDSSTGEVLMLAWMNREALTCTITEGRAVYWSRSRKALWRKGEESGNVQLLREIRLDCDSDALLLKIDQLGDVACHTGRRRCFFRKLDERDWCTTDPILKDPGEMYGDRS